LAGGCAAMGLRATMASLASSRLHVLIVETPGSFVLRATVERAILRRGWRLSGAPADADALVICGTPATQDLHDAVRAVWEQLPGPRATTSVGTVDEVDAELNWVATHYRDLEAQRRDARRRVGFDGQMDHGQMVHGQMDHGQLDDGGHGGMTMAGPGGIALAGGGADRDGLEMDVLHLRLGPILADWPAGLAMWCSLQGDAITGVEVAVADAASVTGPWTEHVAYRIDAAARLLSLAGELESSARLRGLRDGLLQGVGFDSVLGRLAQVHRSVARSRSLQWSLAKVGGVEETLLRQHHWPVSWAGDVHDRLLCLLDVTSVSPLAADRHVTAGIQAELSAIAAVAPLILPGMDLGGARLVVASLVGHPALRSRALSSEYRVTV